MHRPSGLIPPSAEWSPPPDRKQIETVENVHDRIETRCLEVTARITKHLAPSWTGLARVCCLTCRRVVRGKACTEMVYAITSRTAEEAGRARLLAPSREHWSIKNKLHYVHDVTYERIRREAVLAMRRRYSLP